MGLISICGNMADNQKPPKRFLRPCGHPNDWTLDLVDMNDVINSFCLGCFIEKAGLKPVDRYRLEQTREGIKIIHLPRLEAKR